MSEDRRYKPKPGEVKLVDAAAFEREASILFRVPPAEAKAIEAQRMKRPHPKRNDPPGV